MRSPDPFTPGLLTRLPRPIGKVALLRPSRIGDFICATPALRALRAALPQAEITMITLPLLRDLVLRSPHLDRFVAFPGYPGIAEQFFDARRTVAFFQEMQAEAFDLAVQIYQSGVNSNPFTLLLGARATAGFVRAADEPGLLDAALPLPRAGHEVARVLALATFLGAPAQGAQTEYPLWPEDHAAAERLLAGLPRPLLGLHPGAWDAWRQWPLARFAAVGTALQQRFGGAVVVIGGPETREAATAVAQAVDAPCCNLAGETSLGALGGVVGRLALLVTNDSGPAHVAYALGTPTVTVCTGTQTARYGPPAPGPYRMVTPQQPGKARLAEVDAAQVIAAAEALLLQKEAAWIAQ